MLKAKLTTEQFGFLLSKLRDTDAASTGATSIVVAGVCRDQPDPKCVEIVLSREEVREIVFALAIVLAEVGFDESNEPNETGYYIEDIIDTFSDSKECK